MADLWSAAKTPGGLSSASSSAASAATAVFSFNDCCDSGYLVNAAAGGKPKGVVRGGGALVGSSLPVVHAVSVPEGGFAAAPVSVVARTVAAPSVLFTAVPASGKLFAEPKTTSSVAVQANDVVGLCTLNQVG